MNIGFFETPEEIVDVMLSLVGVGRDGLVLDAGVGSGVFVRRLLARGFRNVLGIDIDPALLEEARKEVGKEAKLILGDFLSYEFSTKFDLIVGNPPYVHYKDLPENLKREVRRITGSSNSNIYYAFIMKSIDVLNENGELIYIFPYPLFYNTYARVVREKILKEGAITDIIDLGECRIFKKAQPEVVVVRFVKGKEKEKIRVWKVKDNSLKVREIRDSWFGDKADAFTYILIPHFMSCDSWSVYERLGEGEEVELKRLARVGVGPVSGFDEAFAFKTQKSLNEKEKSMIKRFVKASNCKRYATDGYAEYIVVEGVGDEKQFSEECPSLYEHLLGKRQALESRYLPRGRKWFEWQALRNFRFLKENEEKEKIYVPAIDRHRESRFSLAPPYHYPGQDVLFISPHDQQSTLFLLGYLNSQTFRTHYLSLGARKGDRTIFTQKILANSKIKLLSKKATEEISGITSEIIKAKIKGHNTEHLENKIDNIIAKEERA